MLAPDGLYEYTPEDPLVPLADLLNRGLGPANDAIRDLRHATPGGGGGVSDPHLIVTTGRPDGVNGDPAAVAAATVGTAFRSLDGAGVGAWVWMKRPTGWIVTDGDTGWRDITAGTPTALSGIFSIRRVGGTATLVANAISGASTHIHPVINGFRAAAPARNTSTALLADNSTTVIGQIKIAVSTSFPYWSTSSVSSAGYGAVSWPSDDPWPSTLPGTPA